MQVFRQTQNSDWYRYLYTYQVTHPSNIADPSKLLHVTVG
jgi:hypothetical protein